MLAAHILDHRLVELVPRHLDGGGLHHAAQGDDGDIGLVEGFDKLIESRTGIATTVADNAIACVAEGTGKSLDMITDMQEGTINLSLPASH